MLTSVVLRVNFDTNQQEMKSSALEVRKSISKIESNWKTGNKRVEDIFVYLLLIYLSKGIESAAEFLELQLSDDSLSSINLDGGNSRRNVERSLWILYLQLALRSYYFSPNTSTLGHSKLSIIRQLVTRALVLFPADNLFLAIRVVVEIKSNKLFTVRRYFANYISSQSEFENYLIRRYLNESSSAVDQQNFRDSHSLWNIFMATLHYELLIIDKYSSQGKIIFIEFVRVIVGDSIQSIARSNPPKRSGK